MSLPPESPFAHRSIAQYGAALRRGELSAQAVTRALLERIEHFNPKLGAYTYVAREEALAAARTVDDLVRAGTDLGPLMGVPLAMKDLFHVDGMPLTAGSRLDVSGIVSGEGSFVRALKRGGAIILGKTWTSEFALGGISLTHRVPWNPVDGQVHRTPGGSSGGSAAAVAAGLCAFATGSDTGGSVRMPAAMCGVFGFKMSRGILPLDGIFPLSPTLDSIGIFTATAADAGTVYAALTGAQHMAAASEKLRLGYPSPRFWDGLHPAVEGALRQARSRLESAGAEIVPFDFPELDEIEPAFGSIVPVELVAILGRERIERGRKVFDPVTWPRLSGALDLRATDYLAALEHLRRLRVLAARHLDAYDAWITPTAPDPASSLAEITTVDDAAAWNKRALRNTRPGNMLDQCGVSLPLRMEGGMPPAGLQILCPAAADARLIALACAIEPIVAEKR